jgi:hypothetical protein
MIRKVAPAFLLVVLSGTPLLAERWAEKMFQTDRHDFGTVARDAKTEFRFVLKNIYLEDVHIAGVRASCGCTTPRIEKPLLKTYEEGAIVAHINTDRFLGHKGATITVTFDKPFPATAQLQVTADIRSSVVFEPGSVQFGTVDQGTPAEKTVTVKSTGGSDWRLLGVKSTAPHISAQIENGRRLGSTVTYDLVVRMDDKAPAGPFSDYLMLRTNDPSSPQIPLAVDGEVQPGISVSPRSLFLGVVEPGKKVTKQLVVRSKKPFRILSVTSDGKSFEFETTQDATPKPLHLLPVTFVAGEKPGSVLEKIRINTDLGETTPELSAYAVVAP